MNDRNFLRILAASLAGLVVLAGASFTIARTLEDTTLTIVSKERLLQIDNNGEGRTTSRYRNFAYTADEAYVVQDSMWNGHFRAGTVWAKIPDGGGVCDVTLSGIRFGFLSWHQNIIAADCRPVSK